MRLIPVMDLLNSVVVRGIGGHRSQYLPIESVLCQSTEPRTVAESIRRHFGLSELYVADLDAILSDSANLEIYEQLRDAGFRLLVDCGLREPSAAEAALAAGATKVVVGLETWPLLASLELLVRRLDAERIVFSLDLKNGEAVRGFRDMTSTDPVDIAAAVIEAGIRELIVLDLASVGMDAGLSTLPLCRQIRSFAEHCTIITGGGVRDVSDLKAIASAELDGALIASALHCGTITRKKLRETWFESESP